MPFVMAILVKNIERDRGEIISSACQQVGASMVATSTSVVPRYFEARVA
jgi:hypothetical protein